jgi:hypothetical protein
VLGLLSALLAGPLLPRLATLLLGPWLGLRLPTLFAVPLLALAHRFLLPNEFVPGAVTGRRVHRLYGGLGVPTRPSARFHALPQVSHESSPIPPADGRNLLPNSSRLCETAQESS